MTQYHVNMGVLDDISNEMTKLGNQVQGMIENLNATCQATLTNWTGAAQLAYQNFSNQWTNAANDLPVQATNAAQGLSAISAAYAKAEADGMNYFTP